MCAVPIKVIFCSSLMLIWSGILSRYVSSPFLKAPSAPMITGIVSVLMPHIRLVSISKSLYLDSLSVTFTDVFLTDFPMLLLLLLFSLLSQSLLEFFLCISREHTMHLGHQSLKSIIQLTTVLVHP